MRTVLINSSMTLVIMRSLVRTMSVESIGTLEMIIMRSLVRTMSVESIGTLEMIMSLMRIMSVENIWTTEMSVSTYFRDLRDDNVINEHPVSRESYYLLQGN